MSHRITETVTIGTNRITRDFDMPDAVGIVTSADVDGTVLTSKGDGTYDFEVGPSVASLGVTSATALLAAGETTIYTPSGTDYVAIAPGPAAFVALDHQTVVVSSSAISTLAPPDDDLLHLSSATANTDEVILKPGKVFSTAPIYAALKTDTSGLVVVTPPLTWAALHLYAANLLVHGPDAHLWSSGAGGTSGGTIPDFAGNEAGTVADGSVTWTDEGHIPTAGAVHLYAIVTPL